MEEIHQAVILRSVHFSVWTGYVYEIVCFLTILLRKKTHAPEWEGGQEKTGDRKRGRVPKRGGGTQKDGQATPQGPHSALLQKRESG